MKMKMNKEDDNCCHGECLQGRACPRFVPLRNQDGVPTVVVGALLVVIVLLMLVISVRLW
jgi:hypothetical protein